MAKNYENSIAYSPDWKKMTGELRFSMSNDYLFRALMQKDERTLKAIVASFLKVTIESISEIEVTNPILLGEDIDSKEYHLDIRTLLNHEKEVDLEMQVVRHPGWIERTLVYACRAFSELNHGTYYRDAKPVWQISFCDFTLFEDEPGFVSDFMLMNTKNAYQIYTDKIRLTHVNLTRIDLATEEDNLYGVTDWARLFKAKSWEELKMLTQETPTMDYTISSIYQLAEDEKIRNQIYRREENELLHKMLMEDQEKAKAEIEEATSKAEAAIAESKAKDLKIEQLQAKIQELNSLLEASKNKNVPDIND
jgi:predicted transposase/invertase (TIGR01784 family)